MSNPRRRHRRNPEQKAWLKVLIASAIGAASMGIVSAGAYAVSQRTDMSKINRNSTIAAALAIVVGIWVAKRKNALYGVAIATGGAALLIATRIAVFAGGLLNRPTTPQMAAVFGNMGAYARMNGYQRQMQAVFGNMGGLNGYARKMGAVYGHMGANRALPPAARRPQDGYVPTPNWAGNPF